MHICVTRPQWVNTLRSGQNNQDCFADYISQYIFLMGIFFAFEPQTAMTQPADAKMRHQAVMSQHSSWTLFTLPCWSGVNGKDLFRIDEYLWCTGIVHHIRINILRPTIQVIIGPDNGLSPGRRQAIIWTNAELLSNGSLWNKVQWNFKQNSNFFIGDMHCKMSSANGSHLVSASMPLAHGTPAALEARRGVCLWHEASSWLQDFGGVQSPPTPPRDPWTLMSWRTQKYHVCLVVRFL